VEQEKILLLQEAALRSPSSRSLCPWRFVFIDDSFLLQSLALAKEHGSEFLADAPLGVAVLADPNRCDVWIEDAAIASSFILLQAHDLGLGGCWIQIRERRHDKTTSSEDYVRQILGIPEKYKVLSLLALGYASEKPHQIATEDLVIGKVSHNLWSGD
jgi:nitroreductase